MPAATGQPRFLVDHMLIKLGKYLRILGLDVAWHPGLRTHELIALANREDRIFLSRNTRLAAEYPPVLRHVPIHENDPVRQVEEVRRALGMETTPGLFTHCIRCNVELAAVADKESVRDRVHPHVFARYERFFTCPRCGTVFWKGSHVRNTCRKLGIDNASEIP